MPECIPFREPGADVTGQATAPVIGGRFLAITGDRTADGNLAVAHAPAGTRAIGVAKYDAAVGRKVGVIRGARMVVPVRAAGSIAAGGEVEVGAEGQAVAIADGVAVGYVETGVSSGQDARVVLY